MRALKIALFCAIIAILFVGVYMLRYIGDQHRHIDTSGEIVFASDMGSPGKSHVFVAKPGEAPKQLTKGAFSDTAPSYSPDGSQITFISDRSGAEQVYVMDADGLNPHVLTFGTDSKDGPKFAPDGRHIAYLTRGTLSVVDVVSGQTNIVLPQSQSLASSNSTQLAQAIRSAVISFEWSPTSDPNKEQLSAVQQNQDGDLQTVALVASDGGNPTVLNGAAATTISAAWSPDGSQLAVAAIGLPVGPKKFASGIVMYGADGNLTHEPPIVMVPGAISGPQSPVFNPDGSQIVFEVASQTKLGNQVPEAILRIPASPGSRPSLLIKGGGHDPQFSPDGGHLLFLAPSPRNANLQDIYVMDVGTNQTIDLTNGEGMATSACWSPTLPKKQ